jgi:hypothetical protein
VFLLSFLPLSPACALTAEVSPDWLAPYVLRGLAAVWSEIPHGPTRLETLSIVASRLFSGYGVAIDASEGEPKVVLEPLASAKWSAAVAGPILRPPVSDWFAADVRGMDAEIASIVDGLPVEALAWADSALRDRVEEVVARRLPGWGFSLLVREADQKNILQVSLNPAQPVILAVTPSVFSSTMPVMFQSDLAAKLLPGLSPLIGMPLEWTAIHKADVERFAATLLEDRNAVSNTRSMVEASFEADQVSRLDAVVESDRFIFLIWIAAYAGVEGRYPEAGVTIGWNARRELGFDLEIYDEAKVDVSSFGLHNRIGFRFPVLSSPSFKLRLGAEWSHGDAWVRAWADTGRIRRPYAWWRYSPEHGHNAALGYRVDEHISIELHYDARYKNKIGLRGILLL